MATSVLILRLRRFEMRRLGERIVTAGISVLPRACDTIDCALSPTCAVFCLVISLSLSACSSTRPVVKIGLLAPFEGLHRESGYEALAAMRAALADYPLVEVEALPLALDTSADPRQARRAALKMLRDDSVVAVVGPIQARTVSAVADVIAASDLDWWLPTTPATEEKAQALIVALIAEIAGQNILLAGLDAGWPQLSAMEWSAKTGKTVTVADDEDDGTAADGVLWLGDALEGAAFLARLRSHNRTVPFWTTNVAGDSIFSSLMLERLAGVPPGPVYWAVGLDESADQYSEWVATHGNATPTAFAVYQATRRALAQVAGHSGVATEPGLAVFALDREGRSELAEIVPFPKGW